MSLRMSAFRLCLAHGGFWRLIAAAALAAVLASGSSMIITGARAQGFDYYSQLSCSQLWYERNALYAQYGYCFQSQRAINTFGIGCFPPYGQLPSNLQRVVSHIQAWERRRGCR